MKETTEYLRHDFTAGELTALAHEMALNLERKDEAERRKSQVAKQMAGEIEALEITVRRARHLYAQGYEYRNIACTVEMDCPIAGHKSLRRNDTGEVVKVSLMTADDRQGVLALEEEQAGETLAEQSAGEGEADPDEPGTTVDYDQDPVLNALEDARLAQQPRWVRLTELRTLLADAKGRKRSALEAELNEMEVSYENAWDDLARDLEHWMSDDVAQQCQGLRNAIETEAPAAAEPAPEPEPAHA